MLELFWSIKWYNKFMGWFSLSKCHIWDAYMWQVYTFYVFVSLNKQELDFYFINPTFVGWM